VLRRSVTGTFPGARFAPGAAEGPEAGFGAGTVRGGSCGQLAYQTGRALTA